MRRLVAEALGLMPLDERGRRVMDETLRDWAHEAEVTSGLTQSIQISARGLGAITRSLMGIALTDSREAVRGQFVGRLLLFVVLPCILFAATNDGFAVLSARGWSDWLTVKGWALATALAIFAPLGSFVMLATIPIKRGVPAIGWALAMTVLVTALTGWVLPEANQQVRVGMLRTNTGNAQATLARGFAEMTPFELAAAVWDNPASRAVPALTRRSGLVASALLLALLGGAVALLPPGLRRRWAARVVAGYLALFLLLWPTPVIGGGVFVWITVAGAALALAYVRRTTPSTLQPA